MQRIRLYEADRAQAVTIPPPAGTTVDSFDFDSRNGRVELFYAARPMPLDQLGRSQVFRWSSSAGQTRLISSSGTYHQRVLTDGARVAWSQATAPAEFDGSEARLSLLSQPLDGGAATTLSGSVRQSVLRDGLLAWLETTPTGIAIKVSTLAGTQTIATDTLPAAGGGIGPGNEDSTWLFDTSAGFVLYRQGRKFFTWNVVTNQSRVVMDTADVQAVQLNGRFVFFTIARSLYRVPLGP